MGVLQDQFVRAAPVQSGIGMALLQKMGWKQGEGLGKNNEGSVEPLALDFKMDRRGNVCYNFLLSYETLQGGIFSMKKRDRMKINMHFKGCYG